MAAKPATAPDAGEPDPVRVGFTASRKVGGAVQRNRAKRRLRAAARAVMPGAVVPGFDYVLVARAAVLTCRFAELEATLRAAMAELTKARARATGPSGQAASPVAAGGASPEPASPPSTAR
jgi:ribonuclease P protein component